MLTREETDCLAGGGETVQVVSGRVWRLAHESYSPPDQLARVLQAAVDRHVSLTAAEVDVIAGTAEGLVVGDTTIRSWVAS